MTKQLWHKLLTDPDEDDLRDLWCDVSQMILSTVIAGCIILSAQKFLFPR